MSLIFRRHWIALATLVLLSLGFVQGLFLSFERVSANRDRRILEAILRNEDKLSNVYQISRTLTDLKATRFIQCISLKSQSQDTAFLDSYQKQHCETSSVLVDGVESSVDLTSFDGQVWTVNFLTTNSTVFYIFLWTFRIFLTGTALVVYFLLRKKWQQMELLEAIGRAEMEEIQTKTRQVAHDLASPFTALRVLSSKEHLSGSEIAVLKVAVARGYQIVQTLNQKSKETQRPSKRMTNLSLLLERCVREKEIEIEEKILFLKPKEEIFCKSLDEGEFTRVISNLLNNAFEAQVFGRDLFHVKLERADKFIQICISDKGKGIPKEIIGKITDKGFTFEKSGGSGLGLYHAKRSVEQWGGKLYISSSENRGTNVYIDIPD